MLSNFVVLYYILINAILSPNLFNWYDKDNIDAYDKIILMLMGCGIVRYDNKSLLYEMCMNKVTIEYNWSNSQ